ncbi:hypothetical protein [Tenacibaculum maritimum]|uniref:hypothetical protein n=1 Tax=Tenacibaculum maritimum TaxID=107401 RepID=UPI0012E6DBD7|nr:hypothetical protein [Tenacibaculum maritimum]CAA0224533.1 Probable transmembrane hypothetical protein [Tenacibaculum maritimum]
MLEKIKNFWKAKLPFEILVNFDGLDKEFVKNEGDNKGYFYKEVNDERIIINTNLKSGIILTSILMVVFIFFLLVVIQYVEKKEKYDDIFLGLTLLVPSLVLIVNVTRYFLVGEKYIILDRKKGKIHFQKPIGKKKYIYFFDDMEAGWKGIGGTSPQMLLVIRHKKTKEGLISPMSHIVLDKLYGTLSFYIWYMDKNRPLPSGSAFDAYREQDYQRRKAAGFPKPLYPSKIATPEATKEQQAARKRIGGW